jgi:hypothetical protein
MADGNTIERACNVRAIDFDGHRWTRRGLFNAQVCFEQ